MTVEIDITPESVLTRKLAEALATAELGGASILEPGNAVTGSPHRTYLAERIWEQARAAYKVVAGSDANAARAAAEKYRRERMTAASVLSRATDPDEKNRLRKLHTAKVISAADDLMQAVLDG